MSDNGSNIDATTTATNCVYRLCVHNATTSEQYYNQHRAESRDDRDRSRSPQNNRRDDSDSEHAPAAAAKQNRSRSPLKKQYNTGGDESDGGNQSAGDRDDGRGGDGGGSSHRSDDRHENNPGNNLFVTHMSKDTKEEDMEEAFSRYGIVQDCKIVKDPNTRESRGFGFIAMETVSQAEAALEALNGYELNGSKIIVQKARRNRARSPTPGQYRGIATKRRERPHYRPYSSGGGRGRDHHHQQQQQQQSSHQQQPYGMRPPAPQMYDPYAYGMPPNSYMVPPPQSYPPQFAPQGPRYQMRPPPYPYGYDPQRPPPPAMYGNMNMVSPPSMPQSGGAGRRPTNYASIDGGMPQYQQQPYGQQ
ncbi:hypothetical protein MP228_003747 [Amoeboaphelidium protococcarum]|nr:hypothetical protein MP228_003747 [Amoeboaphelidium protococcarum]